MRGVSEVAEKGTLLQKLITFADSWLLFSFSDKLKFAIKVSLALTLAYMIPMAMGWSQPETAAVTVMLIATAGTLSESVMKGTLRVLGTVVGAGIGLGLIALFPQERMLYLSLLSLMVAVTLYLYYAYQGDNTAFMLMALIMMMVFQEGDPDNAFLYGIDRTYMTLFGILVYTFVGLFLWPVAQEDSTIEDAQQLNTLQHELFTHIINKNQASEALLEQVRTAEQKLQNAYVRASGGSLEMVLEHTTWEEISRYYHRLNGLLTILAAHDEDRADVDYRDHIAQYDTYIAEIEQLFTLCQAAWKGERQLTLIPKREVHYRDLDQERLSNLEYASIVAKAETLQQIHESLRLLADRLNVLQGASASVTAVDHTQKRAPRFIWLDPESIKGALQSFLIFWFSTLMWIYLNPPGGFTVVILATILSVLTSFSTVKPSTMTLLFSFSFIFATLMYVGVLPHLVYGVELALFIFFYTFIAFYFIPISISVMFLIGLFTLQLSNEMYYNFALFLNILLVFYLFLAVLMLFYYLPFSTKPEHLFWVMKRRLFSHASALLKEYGPAKKRSWTARKRYNYHREHLMQTAQKLKLWATQIDHDYFQIDKEALSTYTKACEAFSSRLDLMMQYEERLASNPLYITLESLREHNLLADFTTALKDDAKPEEHSDFMEHKKELARLDAKISSFREAYSSDKSTKRALSEIYMLIALHHSVWLGLKRCYQAGEALDLNALQKSRF